MARATIYVRDPTDSPLYAAFGRANWSRRAEGPTRIGPLVAMADYAKDDADPASVPLQVRVRQASRDLKG